MELVLIRHGRPIRVEGVAGGADPPLSECGHRQAQRVAEWLAPEGFDAAYTSPMLRALQTAAPFEEITGLTAELAPGVSEFGSDSEVFIPMEELKADKEAYRHWVQNGMGQAGPEFYARVRETLGAITARHRGEKVVVFCHGGVINAWTCRVLGLPDQMFLDANYTSTNRYFASSEGVRSVYSLNDFGHLRPFPDLQIH